MLRLNCLLIFISLYFLPTCIPSVEAGIGISYIVHISEVIRPGSPITFTIKTWLKESETYSIEYIFYSSDMEFERTSTFSISGESSLRVEIGTVPLGYSESTEFTFNITGTKSIGGEQEIKFHNSTSDFQYTSKALTVLIQSDKAIYQPGETVRFRALCLTPELRPISGSADYEVQDPRGNVVLLQKDVQLTQGVAGGEISLTRQAINGEWIIKFTVQGYEESLSVGVEFYKLPKFEVKVDSPSFIHPESEGFMVTLTGTYTYGELVKGTGTLDLTLHQRYGGTSSARRIRRTLQNFDGSEEVYISRQEIIDALGWDGKSRQRLAIIGRVSEIQTDITFDDTFVVEVMQHKVKVDTLFKLDTIKPGLDYTAYIRVSEQDGTLLMQEDQEKNQLVVEVEYRYAFVPIERGAVSPRTNSKPEILVLDVPDNGVVVLTLRAKEDNFTTVTIRPYTNETAEIYRYRAQWDANRAESPSDSFLQISSSQGSVAPGEVADLTIRTTESVAKCRVQVISRGEVVIEDVTMKQDENDFLHKYQFPVERNMIPSVNVLVYYIRKDGEIVADQIQITVSFDLNNEVTVTGPSERVDVQTNVDIRVDTSAPGSFVGVRAIDQSVLLLRSGNDITEERVSQDLGEYSTSNDFDISFFRFWYFPRSSGAKDAFSVFQEAGIIVLTDANLYQAPIPDIFPLAFSRFSGVTEDTAESAKTSSPSAVSVERSDFPETWIWESRIAGEDGSATISARTPDTITSWVVTSFSMSEEYGLGVSNPLKVTVFRDFFITMNLPLTVIRGEIAIVQVVVFNYFDEDLEVDLTLHINDKFIGIDLIRPGDDPIAAGQQRNFVIPAGGSHSVKYPLRFNILGGWDIRASASSVRADDALVRRVWVKPEGIQQCYSASALINKEQDSGTSRDMLEVKVPAGAVPGSQQVNLHVYGDILGSTMSNLQNLLRAPGGCGEQNMVTFAPDVFVTLYLNNTGMLTGEKQSEAYRHFTDGYMNQLRYKRSDGSFSAFGERDMSGSTWLTAFVAKCFIFARQLRPELVESRVLEEALVFLLSQQNKNGSFSERGRLLNTRLQGGVGSLVTLTAYSLIALRETYYFRETKEIIDASLNARSYLESNLEDTLSDPYALSLVTYALMVSESDLALRALEALNELAIEENGFKYWHEETTGASEFSSSWSPPYNPTPTNDIEMTAYAMLTYVRLGDVESAAPILKWLVSKQNELGGYSSTQDTVIAVQALSAVAELLSSRPQNLSISATYVPEISGFLETSVFFNINEDNSQVYNTALLPPDDGIVTVESTGSGIGIAQLSVCYHIPTSPYEEEPFACTVDIQSPNHNNAMISFCCSLQEGDAEPTGMFLFEIGLLNGFSANEDKTNEENKEAKLVEFTDESVNVYYDELAPNQVLCGKAALERSADVAAVQSATISAFEYYKPEKKATRQYNIEGLRDTGVCDICGYECVGCPSPILDDWGSYSACVELCKPESSSRTRECIDPSLNVVVPITLCGYQTPPTETIQCPVDPNFPCDGIDDVQGLWYDLPSAFGQTRSYRSEGCRAYGGRVQSPRKGIPGSQLNGRFSYIECPNSAILSHTTACSVSMLVRVESYAQRRPTVLFFVGEYDKTFPLILFEKLYWAPYLRATVNFLNVEETIDMIPMSALPEGEWKLVIVSWSLADDLKVYIGSDSMGSYTKMEHPYNLTSAEDQLNLYIGRAAYRNSRKSGYFSGTVSSLIGYRHAITQEQANSIYNFYKPLLQGASSEEEPVLSARQLQVFAPNNLKSCFQRASTLSDIYKFNSPMCELAPSSGDLPPVAPEFLP